MGTKTQPMIDQKHCPFCKTPARSGCEHLALAVEAREFVRRCVEKCQGQRQWRAVCLHRFSQRHLAGEWSSEREDFTWLETAFCDEFLKRLHWFGAMDYEWRSGPKPGQGGFWVLLWSKDPQRLWWELRDEFERQSVGNIPSSISSSGLARTKIALAGRPPSAELLRRTGRPTSDRASARRSA